MKKLIALVMAVAVFVPTLAFAGASTDAALGLGAFAVFNQMLGGVGIFHRGPVVAPAPVVVAAPVAALEPPASEDTEALERLRTADGARENVGNNDACASLTSSRAAR